MKARHLRSRAKALGYNLVLIFHLKFLDQIAFHNVLAYTPIVLLGTKKAMQEQDGVPDGLAILGVKDLVGKLYLASTAC